MILADRQEGTAKDFARLFLILRKKVTFSERLRRIDSVPTP